MYVCVYLCTCDFMYVGMGLFMYLFIYVCVIMNVCKYMNL